MKRLLKLLFRKTKTRDGRRYKRFRTSFLVKYEVGRGGEARITNARDIGAGGIRFWADEKIPERSVLKVSIYLPPLDRTVEALVQVLRVRRVKKSTLYSIAVNFLDLRSEDREAVNEFAESLSRDKNARFLIDHADIVVRSS